MKVCGWKKRQFDSLPGNPSRNFHVSSQHLVGDIFNTLENELFSVPLTLKVASWHIRGTTFQPCSAFQANAPCGLISAKRRSQVPPESISTTELLPSLGAQSTHSVPAQTNSYRAAGMPPGLTTHRKGSKICREKCRAWVEILNWCSWSLGRGNSWSENLCQVSTIWKIHGISSQDCGRIQLARGLGPGNFILWERFLQEQQGGKK